MSKVELLAREIQGLTTIEASLLVREIEARFGVSSVLSTNQQAVVPVEEVKALEQTEFEVVLSNVGPKKMDVLKAIRQLTSLGLKEAKSFVDNVPNSVKQGIGREEAEAIKKTLTDQGAEVLIR